MAKAYICDVCNKHEDPNATYDSPPLGWLTLHKALVSPFRQYHLCSPACLITFGQRESVAAAPELVHG